MSKKLVLLEQHFWAGPSLTSYWPKSRPDVRQVINVYSFMAAPFIGLSIINLIKAGSAVATVALALWVFIPFALRQLAMRKLPQR